MVSLQKWFAHFYYSPFKFMYLLFISSRRNDLGTYFQVGRTSQKYSRLVTLLNFQILSFVQQGPRTNWQADNLYINLACLSVCLSVCLFVCLYPINVKTAEPIGPKFFVGSRVIPGKVYWLSNFQKFASIKIRFF